MTASETEISSSSPSPESMIHSVTNLRLGQSPFLGQTKTDMTVSDFSVSELEVTEGQTCIPHLCRAAVCVPPGVQAGVRHQ